MKKILIVLLAMTFALGVSAQRKGGGYHHVYRSRVVVVPSISYGVGFGYPYFGYPYFGSPFGYPYGYPDPYYYSRRMPSKLTLEIQSIKEDYRHQIKETRKNKSLGHAEKRKEIRSLKAERDKAIIDAEMNYSRPGRSNHQSPESYQQYPENDHSSPGS